ncbi:uncharacterized protein LOC128208263 isoform X2 [Mya arenaria]|uniref:uncharacterized protein LOC128208263 isoform X2 n=1 Tax=Mya arenaria TaxID=6604 RepID=UPI0022E9330C|nr:uncharacterized protein LOC128208263 isoform X2 [Mya arenaria]
MVIDRLREVFSTAIGPNMEDDPQNTATGCLAAIETKTVETMTTPGLRMSNEDNVSTKYSKDLPEGWPCKARTTSGDHKQSLVSLTDFNPSPSQSFSKSSLSFSTRPIDTSSIESDDNTSQYQTSRNSKGHSSGAGSIKRLSSLSDGQPKSHPTSSSTVFTLNNSVNTACFEAAIQEDFGHRSNIDIGHYISKVRNLKSRKHRLLEHGGQKRREKILRHSSAYVQYEPGPLNSASFISEQQQLYQDARLNSARSRTMPSQGQRSSISSASPKLLCSSPIFSRDTHPFEKSNTYASCSTRAVSPCRGASLSETEISQGTRSSKPSSDKLDLDMKKYRYNQTAMALQQSGLMKTTVKTAELLRKSRLLQQELIKLRRETTFFVHSVLNNPENKHLKDIYFRKGNNEKPTENE